MPRIPIQPLPGQGGGTLAVSAKSRMKVKHWNLRGLGDLGQHVQHRGLLAAAVGFVQTAIGAQTGGGGIQCPQPQLLPHLAA